MRLTSTYCLITATVVAATLFALAGVAQTTSDLWSLQPIASPSVPVVKAAQWPIRPLDRFVVAQLEERGLAPSAPANKRTWLRRVSFDLIGLPPSPEEIEAFLTDDSPQAHSSVVDRLLASPHFGERWARHWMDVARYAEDQAHSFKPRLYPHGYRYRDWIIRAFNEDMPYDRFVTEQVAGDLLDEPGRSERLPALGFFALGPVYYGGNKQKSLDELEDRVDTFARGVLGLTVACARCHDHKFDPISMDDYYALAGIFASSKYEEIPLVEQQVVDEFNAAKKSIDDQQNRINDFLKGKNRKKLSEEHRSQLSKLEAQLRQLKADAPPEYAACHAWVDSDKPRDMPVYDRGDIDAPGDVAPRRFLSALDSDAPAEFATGSGRLQLARHVADANNPLTARVFVNRVWQRMFGRGIVATPSNFGTHGSRPTHPQLLDHLAHQFIKHEWSLKWLVREIVLSATYRQCSEHNEANAAIDEANTWLWRMNRRRLDVEAWRDAMLFVSGELDTTTGGPSLDLSDTDNHRRTVYAKISRHNLDPLLRLFDFPDANVTSAQRTITTVPIQQMFVLNSKFMISRAKALAARIEALGDASIEQRIVRAYVLTLGRGPSPKELEISAAFLQQLEYHESVDDLGLSAWQQFAQVLLASNEFQYID